MGQQWYTLVEYARSTSARTVQRGEPMTDPVCVGLWGCGNMGTSLARALVATGEATLATAYDTLSESASWLAKEYGCQTAESAQALLSHPRLDAVIIALPSYLHVSAVTQAAEAGMDVFVEKPMALTVAACHDMLSVVQRCGVKLMVGQVLRYYEPYRSIRRWTASGQFGGLYAASFWRLSEGKGFAVHGSWRGRRAQSGGYLFEVGIHELDMLRCLMGQPQQVYAITQKVLPRQHEIEDYVALQVRFARGGVALYEGGSGSNIGRYGFRLHFEEATLISDAAFDPQALQIHQPGNRTLALQEVEFSSEHPVEAELRGWLSALRDEKPIPIPGEEGLAAVALAEAAYRSADIDQIVTYDHAETDKGPGGIT
jgi:predicted dehydrogenase